MSAGVGGGGTLTEAASWVGVGVQVSPLNESTVSTENTHTHTPVRRAGQGGGKQIPLSLRAPLHPKDSPFSSFSTINPRFHWEVKSSPLTPAPSWPSRTLDAQCSFSTSRRAGAEATLYRGTENSLAVASSIPLAPLHKGFRAPNSARGVPRLAKSGWHTDSQERPHLGHNISPPRGETEKDRATSFRG